MELKLTLQSSRLGHRYCFCQNVEYGIENYGAKVQIALSYSQIQCLEIETEICSANLYQSPVAKFPVRRSRFRYHNFVEPKCKLWYCELRCRDMKCSIVICSAEFQIVTSEFLGAGCCIVIYRVVCSTELQISSSQFCSAEKSRLQQRNLQQSRLLHRKFQ